MKYQREELLKALQNPKELKRLRNTTHHKADKNPGDNDVEKALADWLGRLKLLHGLPFNYLVPDTKMLPEESLRFFYFNTLWLDYLQEGALSLGRSTSSMKVHDQAFASDLDYLSRWGMRKQRSKVLGHLVHHLHPDELKALNADPIPVNEKVTGFLLRSGVVSGWEGLQIEAFHDKEQTQPATLLRMDHLGPNVLFCMYEGEVKSFRIHEYPETLHFGVDTPVGASNDFTKSFRYVVDVDGHAAGTQVKDSIAPPVQINEYERQKGGRVVKVNALAKAMQKSLETSISYDGPFTAAEFALEMVEGVQAVNFQIEY